ncbi:phosphatase [Sphingomonas sp.]|uniref:phosphatase n=1 Tax=Sphingomonas sp. TaxID=28214 RepID=UPI0035BC4044
MTAPTPVETLAAAEARVAVAHQRLTHTVTQLQAKLDPRERAHRAAREARIVGETATAIAKDKPEIVAGVAAAGILFLARHRIARLFRRRRKNTPPAHAGLTPVMRTHP